MSLIGYGIFPSRPLDILYDLCVYFSCSNVFTGDHVTIFSISYRFNSYIQYKTNTNYKWIKIFFFWF